MTSKTEIVVAPPAVEAQWNETNLIFSLARLQEMHIQLRHLRESIAQIVDPTLSRHPSPEDFYTSFSHSAVRTANEIKSFTKLSEDTRSKEILERSKESRAIAPECIKDWIVSDHEDWLEVKVEDANDNMVMEEEVEEVHNNALVHELEDTSAIVDIYRDKYPGIEITLGECSRIKVHLPAPAHIKFDIESNIASETQPIYNITCKEKSNFHAAIVRTIAARPRPNDLRYLFEMLASYIDVKSRQCLKCRRLLDQNAQFPVVRMRKRTKESDGHFTTQWQAFHAGCA